LSISIMGLSSEAFESENIKDYQKLCYSTTEGMYLNIVDRLQKGDEAANRFLSTMEVYPSEKVPIMKEVIQGL